ncbi:MAG: HD domain-containing phosphohydrolase [Agathobacter sp.]|nr:HD domain-containing phosphohydrolase [Agathobacter sp.]
MLFNKAYADMAEIGIALTAEKDENKLLDKILTTIIDLALCDAGILYLCTQDKLNVRLMKNPSQEEDDTAKYDENMKMENSFIDEEIDIPPVYLDSNNVCACAARDNIIISINDVDYNTSYDFSQNSLIDEQLECITKSMLVLPLRNAEGNIVGVIQLLNPSEEQYDEYIMKIICSQAAVAITNMLYIREMKHQMNSFATAFAEAIDARTPYNGTHTKKVAQYAIRVAEEINDANARGETKEYFDESRTEQLYMAAYLHDIGKMIVPLAVMNKASRLDKRFYSITSRFKLLKAYFELDFLKGITTEDEYSVRTREIDEFLSVIKSANTASNLEDDIIAKINQIGKKTYTGPDDEKIRYLTDDEIECLSIKRGTLTEKERVLMESHVAMTERILDKVYFNSQYDKVKKTASSHHEYLDGSGYPHGLTDKDLSLDDRILAVVDIYDALTSKDRPYKKPVPVDKAFTILGDMVKAGKLDGAVVDYLGRCIDLD